MDPERPAAPMLLCPVHRLPGPKSSREPEPGHSREAFLERAAAAGGELQAGANICISLHEIDGYNDDVDTERAVREASSDGS